MSCSRSQDLLQESSRLVLKGGAAVRVLTASARYTQDLDFDHDPRRSLTSLQKTVRSAIARALQGSGLTKVRLLESLERRLASGSGVDTGS